MNPLSSYRTNALSANASPLLVNRNASPKNYDYDATQQPSAHTQQNIEMILSSIFTLLQSLETALKSLTNPQQTAVIQQDTPLSTNVRPSVDTTRQLPTRLSTLLQKEDTGTVDTENLQFPDLSSKINGAAPNDIEKGFYSVPREFGENRYTDRYAAMIKLMMMRYGQSPTDCFDKITRTGDTYAVYMKDGESVQITRAEIKLTADAAKFAGDDIGMIKDANFMLTAYVKRVQETHEDPVIRSNFEAALRSVITKEGHEKNILEDLGMAPFMIHANAHEMSESKAPCFMYGYGLVLDKEALPYDGHGYILS
ncbi:hypothetical protein [Pseudomonas rhodesiae]|uniref:hypothetical protein n=1 Tax=Pseudomonas rhodesiae TaxID=76760 RepID=UPI000F4A698A|nr:hypothetical protein [Pseudomonas rhodesiae]ROM59337.1 hypothetical protein BK651_26375 [Pseudomonas rhodesiae]ROM61122.1 hypothetical protein BK650_00285 [Pseudomonas rhodesiae]WLI29754.1 hypothetical protein PSH61_01220 [Pseudomonas rhodesiae]